MLRHPEPDWQQVTAYLIGRGKGLTPSGDDLLVAYQAMFYAFDQPAEKLATALAVPLSTTDVSKAYISASIKGYVNSLIYRLLTDLKKPRSAADRKRCKGCHENRPFIGH